MEERDVGIKVESGYLVITSGAAPDIHRISLGSVEGMGFAQALLESVAHGSEYNLTIRPVPKAVKWRPIRWANLDFWQCPACGRYCAHHPSCIECHVPWGDPIDAETALEHLKVKE